MEVSEIMEYYRLKKDISLNELARITGISIGGLCDFKSGKTTSNKRRSISLDNAAKIAEALDITIDELYYGRNIEINSPAGEIKMEE